MDLYVGSNIIGRGGSYCSGPSVKSHYDISFCSFCRLELRIYILPLYLYFKLRSFLPFLLTLFVLIRDYFDVTAKHKYWLIWNLTKNRLPEIHLYSLASVGPTWWAEHVSSAHVYVGWKEWHRIYALLNPRVETRSSPPTGSHNWRTVQSSIPNSVHVTVGKKEYFRVDALPNQRVESRPTPPTEPQLSLRATVSPITVCVFRLVRGNNTHPTKLTPSLSTRGPRPGHPPPTSVFLLFISIIDVNTFRWMSLQYFE